MFDKLSYLIRVVLVKIIVKVPWLKQLFVRIIYLYESAQIKSEREFLSGKREARLNFRHYLPDTAARIERLRKIINKRPVAIILHGPSAKELEARIAELRDCDICYFGVNLFTVPEQRVLHKINRAYSGVLISGFGSEWATSMQDVADFLDRPEDNMYISEEESLRSLESQGFGLEPFLKKYDKKLLFFAPTNTPPVMLGNGVFFGVPSLKYPLHFIRYSSFNILLSLAVIGEAPMVVVFGGDGGRISGGEFYFPGVGLDGIPESVHEESLVFDTKVFNLTMPLVLEKIYKMYNLKPIDIVNCSLQSNYTALRKLSYDDTFALLKSFNKGTG